MSDFLPSPLSRDPLIPLYPTAIVWSPLPPITWLLPFIGHLGISYSNGMICDFAGPYHVSETGHMAFGNPTRYLPITSVNSAKWDESVHSANSIYGKRMHNLFCDNCHSHVACALNDMEYKGSRRWNMIVLAFWMFFTGRFVGVAGAVKSFGPFAVLVLIVVLLNL